MVCDSFQGWFLLFPLEQENQECHHWKPDQEVIVHAPGSDTEVGGGGRGVVLCTERG